MSCYPFWQLRVARRCGTSRCDCVACRLCADCVEEVGSSTLPAGSRHWVGRARLPSSGRRLRDRDQLGELAEVLGGGGEEELVLGTIRAPQAQAVQLQDALEVGEQHLDLLPLAA